MDKIEIIPYQPDSTEDPKHTHGFDLILHKANNYATPIDYIREKYHFKFFKRYFEKEEGLAVKFIVPEWNYVSRDYLSDYNSYYSTCFEGYPKTCTRLHFFSYRSDDIEAFSADIHTVVIEGTKKSPVHQEFWDKHYLGYMVIKPIPGNFIGFTLLKHFNYNSTCLTFKPTRDYWGTKKYKVHIFGNEVEIDSLAFQEQDTSVSACATIAIWCMLQRAAEDYYVILKSPSEITTDAGPNFDGNRLMPNNGLTLPSMATAIAKNNLETETRHRNNHTYGEFNYYLKKIVYAYAPLKIPLIFLIEVPDKNGDEVGHAVAICGHNFEPWSYLEQHTLERLQYKKYPHDRMIFNADRVTKLYAHDDQWGPFSRFELTDGHIMESSWTRYTDNIGVTKARAVMACIYPKLRVSYDWIEKIVSSLNTVLMDGLEAVFANIVWDIRVHLSEDFKQTIQGSRNLDAGSDQRIKLHLLTSHFPKYIWVVTLFVHDQAMMHLIYDGTGLTGSSLLHSILGYYPEFNEALLQFLKTPKDKPNSGLKELFEYHIEKYIEKLEELKQVIG